MKEVFDFSEFMKSADVVHGWENNRHSQLILDSECERLSKVCKQILLLLLLGGRIDGRYVSRRLKVLEYRRRFKDLIDKGVPVQSDFIKGGGGTKAWWIDKEDIKKILRRGR